MISVAGQVAYLGAVYVYGFLLSDRIAGRLEPRVRAASAFFLGLVAWALAAVVLCSLGLPFTPLSMALCLALGLAAAVKFSPARGDEPVLPAFGAGLAAVLAIAAVCSAVNVSFLSDDSLEYVSMARMIAKAHGFTPLVREQLMDWGVLVPIEHSAATFLGIDYLWALQPVASVCFWAYFALIVDGLLAETSPRLSPARRAVIAAAAVATALSTLFGCFELSYVHTNALGGAFYFLFVGSAFRCLRSGERWLPLAWFGLIGFFLTRNEAAGMAAPVLFLVFADGADGAGGKISRRSRTVFLVSFIGIAVLWFGSIVHSLPEGAGYLGPWHILVMLVPYPAVLAIFALADRHRRVARWVGRARKWELPAVFALGLIAFGCDFRNLLGSVKAQLDNAFFRGLWGMLWVLALPLLLALGRRTLVRKDYLLRQTVFLFLIAMTVMPFRTGTYRVGWWDSANRNLTHILPIVLLYFALAYGKGLQLRLAARGRCAIEGTSAP